MSAPRPPPDLPSRLSFDPDAKQEVEHVEAFDTQVAGIAVQKSQLDNLSITEAARAYWKACLFCFFAAFSGQYQSQYPPATQADIVVSPLSFAGRISSEAASNRSSLRLSALTSSFVQINLAGSIIVNKGFVKQFGALNHTTGASALKSTWIASWGGSFLSSLFSNANETEEN